MLKHICTGLLITACSLAGWSQHVLGTLSNAFNDQPVYDAVISFLDGQLSVQSDRNGQFRITGLGPGRYVLRIQHIQYHAQDIEILLTSSKDVVLTIEMEPRSVPLQEVTVPGRGVAQPQKLYRITEDEVRRFPGTFFDPARFAASFPGVHVANDQANQLVIHGLHPDLMQWRLEGLETVNPNHLSNAGTIGDRSSATGGGVHMISNLMLANSSLMTGAFDSRFGNAISGVMDMRLRAGNTAKAEHTAQLGLLGIDIASEGPFQSGGLSSYAINARYSTVGLLTDLGVDFGDEAIRFSDLAFNAQFHLADDGSKLKVFGFGGFNSNDLSSKDPSEWTEDRDRSEINYESTTGAIGVSWVQPVGDRSLLTISTAFSGTSHERIEERLEDQGQLRYAFEDGETGKWSSSLVLHSAGSATHWRFGVDFTNHMQAIDGYSAFESVRFVGDASSWHIRPYVSSRLGLGSHVQVHLGLGVSYYDYYISMPTINQTDPYFLEPAITLLVLPAEDVRMTALYRRATKALYDLLFIQSPDATTTNRSLYPVIADIFQLKTQLAFPLGVLEGSLFYYDLSRVPVDAEVTTDYSALNLARLPNSRVLGDEGSGKSYGASLAYRRNFSHSWFVTANGSIYRSLYTGSDGIERGTTFDSHHVIFLSGGKEWGSDKDYGRRTFGINGSFIERGGLRQAIVDVDDSVAADRTVYVQGSAGDSRIDGYFRMDLRVYLRKDKEQKSSTWSLDIQNVFNVENNWLPSYDFFQGGIRRDTQLGVVPVLNYRVDF